MQTSLFRNRSNCASQGRLFRNRAQVMRSALYRGNCDHRWLKNFDAARNISLQRKDDLRSDRNGINSVVRLRWMSGLPFDCDPERACPGHNRSGSAKDRAAWVPWCDVNSKCTVRRSVPVEQTFFDHQPCSSVPLFSGLEGEDDATCKAVSV